MTTAKLERTVLRVLRDGGELTEGLWGHWSIKPKGMDRWRVPAEVIADLNDLKHIERNSSDEFKISAGGRARLQQHGEEI